MRVAALLGVCVTAAVVVLGFTVLGGSPSRAGHPALHVVRTAPLTVRGEHFRSREQVRVRAATKVVRTKASADGLFVVTIRGVTRCDVVRVLARGSAGSYAVVKVLPPPACVPARSR
jgi:hypothetical protein